VELPARFEANRIFVDVAIPGGDTLRLFTDTGGGLFIYGHAVDRINLGDSEDVGLRDIAIDGNFPEPLGSPNLKIPVFRPEARRYNLVGDGVLGQAWFADRTWTFDYPRQKLLMHLGTHKPVVGNHEVRLGFRTNSAVARRLAFPRISMSVAGDSLEMLFDTGASVKLTPHARGQLRAESTAVRSTSFVTSEILDRWCNRHPDWRVLPDADERVGGMRMVLVPEVQIAGFSVGPVWFTERPDANFHEYMSQWMDRQIDGAVGGNVLRYFAITVDYPRATAYFVKHQGPRSN
jgi:hypothetical protein